MSKHAVRRTLITGLLIAGFGSAFLYGCTSENYSPLEPERAAGPLASKRAFPEFTPDSGPSPSPTPVAPGGFWNAVVDENNDGWRDVFIAYAGLNNVTLFIGVDSKSLQAQSVIPVVNPVHIAAGDVNGDGLVDLAAYSTTGNTVSIFTNNGDRTFSLAAVRNLPMAATGALIGDYDGDGVGDVFFTTSNADLDWVVQDSGDAYGVVKLTRAFASSGGAGLLVASDCGNEPACNPNSEGEGIQECMRAADCRAEKCLWAACILYTDHWWQKPRYIGAVAACAAVHIVETTLCLPTSLIPKGKLAAAPAQVPAGGRGEKIQ